MRNFLRPATVVAPSQAGSIFASVGNYFSVPQNDVGARAAMGNFTAAQFTETVANAVGQGSKWATANKGKAASAGGGLVLVIMSSWIAPVGLSILGFGTQIGAGMCLETFTFSSTIQSDKWSLTPF